MYMYTCRADLVYVQFVSRHQFQVVRWCDIVVPLHLKQHTFGHLNDRSMHGDKDGRNVLLKFGDVLTSCCKLYVFEVLHGHFKESILWPFTEPINSCTVHICWEHAKTIPEEKGK